MTSPDSWVPTSSFRAAPSPIFCHRLSEPAARCVDVFGDTFQGGTFPRITSQELRGQGPLPICSGHCGLSWCPPHPAAPSQVGMMPSPLQFREQGPAVLEASFCRFLFIVLCGPREVSGSFLGLQSGRFCGEGPPSPGDSQI